MNTSNESKRPSAEPCNLFAPDDIVRHVLQQDRKRLHAKLAALESFAQRMAGGERDAVDAAREPSAEQDGFTAMGRKPFTYEHQPTNVGAWRLGTACREAKPGGDPIDHGLSLLQQLQLKGYGVVPVAAIAQQNKRGGA